MKAIEVPGPWDSPAAWTSPVYQPVQVLGSRHYSYGRGPSQASNRICQAPAPKWDGPADSTAPQGHQAGSV